jgi:hypothetical protein
LVQRDPGKDGTGYESSVAGCCAAPLDLGLYSLFFFFGRLHADTATLPQPAATIIFSEVLC